MRLHIIGSGCPDPREERYGSAFILEIENDWLMVDCGPATTYKMACINIPTTVINHLFFTHHHFDHNADFPCFALTRWDQDPNPKPLNVYGPPPTQKFVARLLGPDGAFFDDWNARIKHPASHTCHANRGGKLPRTAPETPTHDVEHAGLIASGENWQVEADFVPHVDPWLKSLVFRVKTPDGTVVFTGDAGPSEILTDFCRNAENLVICCAFRGSPEKSIADAVTGVNDVASMAEETQPQTVILTHTTSAFSPPGNREDAIVQIGRRFDGRIIFADEKTTISL